MTQTKSIKSSKNVKATKTFRTGSTLLDLVAGGGMRMGLPYGKIINVRGDKSAGKTFLTMEGIAANIHKYGDKFKWNYDDCESGFSFEENARELWNIDVNIEEQYQSDTVEEMDAHVGMFLDDLPKDGCGAYVLDSLDGLSTNETQARADDRQTKAEKGKDVDNDGTYGTSFAKFLSQDFFKDKAPRMEDSNAIMFIISQYRDNINAGLFGKKNVVSGGRALDFYCHTVFELRTLKKLTRTIEGQLITYGVRVEIKTSKSKTPRPFRKCVVTILYDYGIDDIGSNIDFLFGLLTETGELKKDAENIIWGTGKEITIPNLKAFLEEHGEYDECRAARKKAEKKDTLTIAWAVSYITNNPELKEHYTQVFGETFTRDELIAQIEDDPKMARELENRVIEKWERIEAKAASNRRGKYT